ncbi:DMT family transporter [Erythrobacter sp. LQ02-29]|uniref:DMT family transporter n=1 Tax=Erythrobacter sp. LQ02-29 TaxID=2920384 RepID=UPI001F4DCF8E|nr:DMT family transporter [Erythrobacter sp. LQ02-29]
MTSQPAHPPFLSWRVLVPFLLTGTIWGSTWLVITGQIDGVAASWSIAWRFLLATPAMFLVAVVMRRSLSIGLQGQMLALVIGLAQFCMNFNFVYRAELHLTSGIVAVMFGMLMVPNAVFGRLMLGQKITRGFVIGSLVAGAGIALLLIHEGRTAPPFSDVGGGIWVGIALAVGGMLSASFANVVQANEAGRRLPMVSLLAWSMLYGTILDFALAWATAGPPTFPTSAGYWGGIAWLALAGSVVTFPLHYNLVRQIGAGKAAYNGIVTVTVAMVLSTLFEDYHWNAVTISGAILALVGLVIALRSRHSVPPRPVAAGGE